jgi:hypothetical protein
LTDAARRKPAPKKRAAAAQQRARVTVVGALKAELAVMGRAAPELADSTLAAAALALAAAVDAPRTSPTAKSMCARELRELLGELRDRMPEGEERDRLDELTARRVARVAGGSGT